MKSTFQLNHYRYWLIPFFLLLTLKVWGYNAFTHPLTNFETSAAVYTAKNELPTTGVLKQNKDGYVYLKLPDKYVYKLFPMIKRHGFKIPGSIRRHSMPGAHISVFYKGESNKIGTIKELGNEYSFDPQRIKRVRTGRKEYIILEVASPQLEKLRIKYGLSPKLLNHEFHVTLAERYLKGNKNPKHSLPPGLYLN